MHLQTDFSMLNVIMTLRGRVLAHDVNNKISNDAVSLLAQCALLGRNINHLHYVMC